MTPSLLQDSTWCPLQSTGEALGLNSASDTLPLTHNQTVVTPAFKHQAKPPPQDLPQAKAQNHTPTVSWSLDEHSPDKLTKREVSQAVPWSSMGEERADNTNHQEALLGNLSVTQPRDREKQGEN